MLCQASVGGPLPLLQFGLGLQFVGCGVHVVGFGSHVEGLGSHCVGAGEQLRRRRDPQPDPPATLNISNSDNSRMITPLKNRT